MSGKERWARRVGLLAFVVLLALLAYGLHLPGSKSGADAHQTAHTASGEAPASTGAVVSPMPTAENPRHPSDLSGWPRNGQSIVDRWNLLAPLAQAGHVEAACRLGREIRHCVDQLGRDGHLPRDGLGAPRSDLAALAGLGKHLDDWKSELRSIEDNRRFDPEVQAMRRNNHEIQQTLRRDTIAQCDGLTVEQRASSPYWLRLAAERGATDAIVAYLELATLWRTLPGAYHDPEFARWRANTRPMTEQLLRAGDTRAPNAIDRLESEAAPLLLPRDTLRATAARRVREWLATEPSARRSPQQAVSHEKPLPPDQAQAVADLARAMAANYRDDLPKAELAWGIQRWDIEQTLCSTMAAR